MGFFLLIIYLSLICIFLWYRINMKTLIIIPARYASSRFPGKPLVEIGGKSMIRRVYEQCLKTARNVCVATDDQRIDTHVTLFGGYSIMTSDRHKSGTDRCMEAYDSYCREHKTSFDLIINAQGDEPFIDPDQLLSLERAFIDPEVTIATMVKSIVDKSEIFDSNTPKVIINLFNFAMYFSRSPIPFVRDFQIGELPANIPFYKHIGLYAYRPETLREITSLPPSELEKAESLEQLRWLENGYRIKVVPTTIDSHSVDTPEDLKLLTKFL